MEKRHINRNRRLAAAAVAALAMSGFAHSANATLTLELTTDGNGPGTGKAATAVSGTAITLDVWATVTGSAGSLGDVTKNQGLQSVMANFKGVSTGAGSIVGNYALSGTSPQAPWNGNGSSSVAGGFPAGTFIDANGDTAIGSTNNADATSWWIARSGSTQAVSSVSTTSFLLGKLTFTPTALNSGTETDLTLTVRTGQDGALWFEDGTSAAGSGGGAAPVYYGNKDGSNGSITVGAVVALTAAAGGPANAEWTFNTNGGNWSLSSNWTGGVPGAVTVTPGTSGGDKANFLSTGDNPNGNIRAITLDANETVGGMTFDPGGTGRGYAISGAHTITLNNGTPANPTITVNSGNSTISSQVTLSQNATVAGSGGSLAINGNLIAGTHTLNKIGATSVSINGGQTWGAGSQLHVGVSDGNGNVSSVGGTVTITTDPGQGNGAGTEFSRANMAVNVGDGTVDFTPAQPFYRVSSLNVDFNNPNAKILIPAGTGGFAASNVEIEGPLNGGNTDVTRATYESTYFLIAAAQLGAGGIDVEPHAGHNPAINGVGMLQGVTDDDGRPVILLTEDIIGDTNGDGTVTNTDIGNAAGFLDQDPTTFGFTEFTNLEGDTNWDFAVTSSDIGNMAGVIDQSFNVANGPALGGVSAVPEPASLGLLAVGAVGLMRRRRRA